MKGHLLWPSVFSFLILSACQQKEGGVAELVDSNTTNSNNNDNTSVDTPVVEIDPARLLSKAQILEDYSNVSCESLRNLIDYLDQIGNTDYFRGLTGEIYYQPQSSRTSQGVWNHLDKYYDEEDAVKIDAKLYLSRLDVPTRRFNLGFPKIDGSKIKNTEGQDLLEYFSIDFKTELLLGDQDEEGEYEFAVLSDDGVEMTMGENADIILSSPNIQSTKMVCSSTTVTLSKSSSLPTRIRYFQGPRDHIAIMLLWRKAGQSADPLCGHYGVSAFFDFTQVPSVPKPNFHSLIARGWSVVPDHVFRVPREEYMNPCESDYVRDVIEEERDNTCTALSCGDIGL